VREKAVSCRYGLVAYCTGSLFVVLALVVSATGLGPIDDHQFIRSLFQGKSFGVYIMPAQGRFIPLSVQEYVLAASVIGPSPLLFHLIAAAKVFLCGVLLLQCLLLTGAGSWTVAVLWSIVLFSVGCANAGVRLQVGEINVLALLLVFVWATLVSNAPAGTSPAKRKGAAILGLLAIVTAFFYKELAFILALGFGAAEALRFRRQALGPVPRRVWALLILGVCYIGGYGLWHVLYTTDSYARQNALNPIAAFHLFAANDPFLLFIVVPLTALRGLLCIRHARKQTVYDSLLVAASLYVAAYLMLSMYNTYYLLPAYGFAVCGVAGLVASRVFPRIGALLVVAGGVFATNNAPLALSDMYVLGSIANNHYRFVQVLAEWLWANPLPNAAPRNLVLVGVTPGNGAEISSSLKTYLHAFGVPDAAFAVQHNEVSDNLAKSSFYGIESQADYRVQTGDLLIYNPYQRAAAIVPPSTPSQREICRSEVERSFPRWTTANWIRQCGFRRDTCSALYLAYRPYTGYAAQLVTRSRAAIPDQLAPLRTLSYRVRPPLLPKPLRAGAVVSREVMIQNTGNESWPATGSMTPGAFVHIGYRWFDASGNIALEGQRTALPETVLPDETVKVFVTFASPKLPGRYRLVVCPVQEGVRWFYSERDVAEAEETAIGIAPADPGKSRSEPSSGLR